MKRIRVAALAEQDLDDIWYYIAKNSGSIEIANRVVDSIAEAFSLFARAPEAGTKRDEVDPGVRGIPAGNYIIYYRESGPYIVISRVIHGTRDQKQALSLPLEGRAAPADLLLASLDQSRHRLADGTPVQRQVIDAQLAEGLDDILKGRASWRFDTDEEMLESLKGSSPKGDYFGRRGPNSVNATTD